jgi:type I restriction enzyme S subunit
MEVKPGFKQTEVGVIPEEWDEVLLDRVAKRGSGHTPDKAHAEYWDGSIKWVSLADSPALDCLYVDDTFAKITPLGIANSSAVLHPAGTVVLSRDAGVGKSAIMRTEMAVSQHFMAWRCGPELDNHFLYYWLQSEKPEFERIANGNTIKTIGLPYFKALKFPKPPLNEQRAIAEVLRDVDMLLGGLDRLISKKSGLKQAAMQQFLTGHIRLPGFHREWELKRLGKLLTICHGKSQRDVVVENGPYPILATGGQIGTASRPLYDRPSVLIGRKGTIDEPQYMDAPFRTVDTLFYSILHDDNDAKFFYYRFCLIPWMQFNEASGVPSLNARTIESIEIACPEPTEQVAIAGVLSDMDAELWALEQRREKTRDLKQAMMQELLTGKTRLV